MAQEVKYLSYSGLSHFKDRVFEIINPLISENKANILSIQNFLENPVFEEVNTNTLNVISEINLNGTRLFNFDFLSLSGGTITGLLTIKRSPSAIQFNNSAGTKLGYLGINADDDPVAYKADGTTMRHILHSGNYANYALPIIGGALTGPLVFNGSDADRNVIRVNSTTGDATKTGDYGYTLKFLGSGTGLNNALALYADNQASTTQNLATKWLNDGTMYGRSILPHTTNTFDLGSSSVKYANAYATTFTGNLKGSMLSSVSNSSSASITEIPNAIRFDSFLASNTTSGFGSGYNNAILTVGRFETTNYASQIGFSGNGKLYYRSFIGTPLDDSKTWSQIALTSDIPTSLTNTEIDAIFTDLGVTF